VRADSLDATLGQAVAALSAERQGDGWRARARFGGAAGTLDPALVGGTQFRGLGFGDVTLSLRQATGARGLIERLSLHGTQGHTQQRFQRARASLEIETTGRDAFPLELSGTFGKVIGAPNPFELYSVGGVRSVIGDSSVLSQRYDMPMFPTGVAIGDRLLAWRIGVPTSTWTMFFEGASTATKVYAFRKWNRALGMDLKYMLPPVPVAFAPRLYSRGGVAYTLDEPFRKKVRVFLEMRAEP